MPGAVPATSTRALTNATLPYVRGIADLGGEAALAPTSPWRAASTSPPGARLRAGRRAFATATEVTA